MSKIFGIGWNKTGTSSLNAALEILGYKSIHCPTDEQTYKQLVSKDYNLSILSEYDALTDFPAPIIYPQLDVLFPGSKYILTVRDLNSWLDSQETQMKWFAVEASINKEDRSEFFKSIEFYQQWAFENYRIFDKDVFTRIFNNHYKTVTEYFENRDDCLVIDICGGEGWEKLCSFLGKPTPNVSFPCKNTSNELKNICSTLINKHDLNKKDKQFAIKKYPCYISNIQLLREVEGDHYGYLRIRRELLDQGWEEGGSGIHFPLSHIPAQWPSAIDPKYKGDESLLRYQLENRYRDSTVVLSPHDPVESSFKIVAYDVIDHADDPAEYLKFLRSKLKPSGWLFLRCHPWTSRHGEHQDKAFSHLVSGNSDKFQPNPLVYYRNLIGKAGFSISKEEIIEDPLESFFTNHPKLWSSICRHWSDEFQKTPMGYSRFSCGDTLGKNALYGKFSPCPGISLNDVGTPCEVKRFPPNNFGLFDMHGNVWEWCLDTHHPYTDQSLIDPVVKIPGKNVIRGGGCWDSEDNCRSAARPHMLPPETRHADLGFRIVRSVRPSGPSVFTDSRGITFIRIKAGSFFMGSPLTEKGRLWNETRHHVTLTKDFYISQTPITVSQWGDGEANIPKTFVSWSDAIGFCVRMSNVEGEEYRLPTEAEWEYACRAMPSYMHVGRIVGISFIDYELSHDFV